MGDVAKGIKSFKKGMATDSNETNETEEGQPKNITENNQDSDKKE
jgi:sec-independent protein translocase protein TatA